MKKEARICIYLSCDANVKIYTDRVVYSYDLVFSDCRLQVVLRALKQTEQSVDRVRQDIERRLIEIQNITDKVSLFSLCSALIRLFYYMKVASCLVMRARSPDRESCLGGILREHLSFSSNFLKPELPFLRCTGKGNS